MSVIGRIGKLAEATVNRVLGKAEEKNTEAVVDQAVADIQKDTAELTNAVAEAVAAQRQLEIQYQKKTVEASDWHSKATLALKNGDKDLASKALEHERSAQSVADSLKKQIDEQKARIDQYKGNLADMQRKAEDAKNKGTEIKARDQVASANEKVNNTVGGLDPDSALNRLNKAEENVQHKESKNDAIDQLSGKSDERKLEDMKRQQELDEMMKKLEGEVGGKPGAPPPPAASSTPAAPQTDGGWLISG